ncbi:hypothetical protein GGR57DRAFT_503748 [Xylariaceae sp. FL1272]|nr:hypothetical protein GGR57DRAFT_503748 [Xylariaceae sp. FL1272]
MASAPASASPSLTSLPPEIVRQIFESAPDFTAVNALARTARILHANYVAGYPAIYHAVASCIQPEYPFAEQLLGFQEASAIASQSLFAAKNKAKNDPSRDERFLSNACCAAAACADFASETQVHLFASVRGEGDPELRPSERARFKKSFYQLWTLCILANDSSLHPSAVEYLDTRNPIELAGLDEMTKWVIGYSKQKPKGSWLDTNVGIRDAGLDIVHQYCSWERKEKSGHKRIHVYKDEAPLGLWVFFDHTQKYLEQIEAHW